MIEEYKIVCLLHYYDTPPSTMPIDQKRFIRDTLLKSLSSQPIDKNIFARYPFFETETLLRPAKFPLDWVFWDVCTSNPISIMRMISKNKIQKIYGCVIPIVFREEVIVENLSFNPIQQQLADLIITAKVFPQAKLFVPFIVPDQNTKLASLLQTKIPSPSPETKTFEEYLKEIRNDYFFTICHVSNIHNLINDITKLFLTDIQSESGSLHNDL